MAPTGKYDPFDVMGPLDTMIERSPWATEYSTLNEAVPEVNKQYEEQLELANAPTDYDTGNLIASAVMRFAPILIAAAIAKNANKGIVIGSEAGAQGFKSFYDSINEKQNKDKAVAKAKAEVLKDKSEEMRKRKEQVSDKSVDFQVELMKEQGRDRGRNAAGRKHQELLDAIEGLGDGSDSYTGEQIAKWVEVRTNQIASDPEVSTEERAKARDIATMEVMGMLTNTAKPLSDIAINNPEQAFSQLDLKPGVSGQTYNATKEVVETGQRVLGKNLTNEGQNLANVKERGELAWLKAPIKSEWGGVWTSSTGEAPTPENAKEANGINQHYNLINYAMNDIIAKLNSSTAAGRVISDDEFKAAMSTLIDRHAKTIAASGDSDSSRALTKDVIARAKAEIPNIGGLFFEAARQLPWNKSTAWMFDDKRKKILQEGLYMMQSKGYRQLSPKEMVDFDASSIGGAPQSGANRSGVDPAVVDNVAAGILQKLMASMGQQSGG